MVMMLLDRFNAWLVILLLQTCWRYDQMTNRQMNVLFWKDLMSILLLDGMNLRRMFLFSSIGELLHQWLVSRKANILWVFTTFLWFRMAKLGVSLLPLLIWQFPTIYNTILLMLALQPGTSILYFQNLWFHPDWCLGCLVLVFGIPAADGDMHCHTHLDLGLPSSFDVKPRAEFLTS